MSDVDQKKGKKIPVIGWTTILKWTPAAMKNALPTVVKFLNEKGDLLDVKWTERMHIINVNHPSYVQHILKSNQENYSRRAVLGDLSRLLGDGLFASEGKLWERQHKLLKPALHHKLVSSYINIIHIEGDVMLKKWAKRAKENKTVDIEYDINVLMLKILIKTQFTSDADEDFDELLKNFRIFLNENSAKKFYGTEFKNTVRGMFGLKKTPSKNVLKTLAYTDKVIQSIRKTAAKNPENRGLALQVLEEAVQDGVISDQQLGDEIKNFLFGGFDTTSSALTWALYCNSKHKNQSKELQSEIDSIIGTKHPMFEDIPQMKYTKRFIQESLRLYPPVFMLVRESVEDDIMEGYFIPKKTWVSVNVYALHRHPDYWKKPEEFDPSRFLPENFKGKNFVYIPFGQGKRSCIGQPLAMAELQIILPMILQRFSLEPVDKKEPVIESDIIIKPKHPMMMKLTPRS